MIEPSTGLVNGAKGRGDQWRGEIRGSVSGAHLINLMRGGLGWLTPAKCSLGELRDGFPAMPCNLSVAVICRPDFRLTLHHRPVAPRQDQKEQDRGNRHKPDIKKPHAAPLGFAACRERPASVRRLCERASSRLRSECAQSHMRVCLCGEFRVLIELQPFLAYSREHLRRMPR